MERSELEQWIEAHYGELLAVAIRRHKRAAADVLHTAIAGMFASKAGPGPLGSAGFWTWAVALIRGAAKDRRVSDQRQNRLKVEAKNIQRAALVLGQRRERGKFESPLSDDSAKYLKTWARETREALTVAFRRRHHKGEAGVSYVRHGHEDQQMGPESSVEIPGRPAVPWTAISQSTGRQNAPGYRGRR